MKTCKMAITGVWRDQNGYRIRPQTLGTECHKTRPLAEALTYSESLAKITPCMQACILCPSLQPAESSWTSFEKKFLKNISLQKYRLFVFRKNVKTCRAMSRCSAQPSPEGLAGLSIWTWLAGPKMGNVNFPHFPIFGVKNKMSFFEAKYVIWKHLDSSVLKISQKSRPKPPVGGKQVRPTPFLLKNEGGPGQPCPDAQPSQAPRAWLG